jgi:hypothetical protein
MFHDFVNASTGPQLAGDAEDVVLSMRHVTYCLTDHGIDAGRK